MQQKTKDLLMIGAIYVLAYAIGYAACVHIEDILLRYFVFDAAATVVTFVFSVIYRNSSVYDAYWSLTPMVMSLHLFASMHAVSPWQLTFLAAFNLWSLRLTVNWVTVTSGFSYEDWRYRMLREKNPPAMWQFLNFTGIHMVPTLVVFAGMLPMFEIARLPMGPMCLPGVAVILSGVLLELFADRQMHAFLHRGAGCSVCRDGLWGVSRHPNYLGEITVWIGVWLTMLPYCPARWYYGVGALLVAMLFALVSIPMMEKRQLARRPDYAVYRRETPCLVPRFGRHIGA